jgi:ammonium transporter Rh
VVEELVRVRSANSSTIHMFGAAFGMVASLMMTPKEARGHENNAANYHSDILAMVGTIFLWMYWPSFNAALGSVERSTTLYESTRMIHG